MFEIIYKSFGYKMYYFNNYSYLAAIVMLIRYTEHMLIKFYFPADTEYSNVFLVSLLP